MMKRDSEAWRLAVRICRRKGVNRYPVALSADGQSVTFASTIRGNQWVRTLAELRAIAGTSSGGASCSH